MIETRFNEWMESHPHLNDYILPETAHWGRLICEWNEQQAHVRLHHLYAAVIDQRNGAIYLDCSPLKIALKCLGLAILYPTSLTIRSIYLICFPVSLAIDSGLEIYDGRKEQLTAREICQRVAQRIYRNLMDCLRTPLYATALSLTCLTSSCLIAIKPNQAYDLRCLIGRIEKSYRWGDSESVIAPCFQPRDYLYDKYEARKYSDTIYDEEAYEAYDDVSLMFMSNFARAQIRFWRKQPCLNGWIQSNSDKVYITPGYAWNEESDS